jgi:hypothetical protein
MGPDYVTEEGYTEAEEAEALQVSRAEQEAKLARAKKVQVAMRLAIAALGTYVVVSALRRLSSRLERDQRPSPAVPPQGPRVRGQIPDYQPKADERGCYGPPKIRRSADTNERGNYGPPKIRRSAAANERGNYGKNF